MVLSLGASVDEWYNAAPHMRSASLFQQQLGCVTPQAFGLAVGLPHRRIVSLDTDGGMMFNLGILATLANEQPKNLLVVVWDNECYQSIGGPPTHTAGRADIAAIARGAGIEHAYTVKTLDDFDRALRGRAARAHAVCARGKDRPQRPARHQAQTQRRPRGQIHLRPPRGGDREHRHHGAERAQLETGSFIMRMLAVILALLVPSAADAAEINALISTALKAATDELLPPFERAHGHTIRASYGPSGALIPRFNAGQPADIFLTDSAAIDELIKEGKVVPGRTDLARTGIGIAVRRGAPKPDVSSPEALKQALLAARSVGHAAPAGGSITAPHIMRMFEQLGIAEEMAPKVRLAAGGPTAGSASSSRAARPTSACNRSPS